MKIARYFRGQCIDEEAKRHILKQKEEMVKKEDDRLYFCVGPTGAGKSMLVFHLLTIYNPNLVIDYIVQERKLFARALKKVKDLYLSGLRELWLWFDEADTDNLEQQARWNKRLFAMYMKLRKLGILHFWCYPSLKSIDRRFVEEKLSGVYLCYDKATDRPRRYYFFKKEAILAMMDADIRLSIPSLRKNRKKYAKYMGYYLDYTGPLRSAYDAKKIDSMSNTVDEFADEFDGSDADTTYDGEAKDITEKQEGFYTVANIAMASGRSEATVRAKLRDFILKGILPATIMGKSGRARFTDEQAQKMFDWYKKLDSKGNLV